VQQFGRLGRAPDPPWNSEERLGRAPEPPGNSEGRLGRTPEPTRDSEDVARARARPAWEL